MFRDCEFHVKSNVLSMCMGFHHMWLSHHARVLHHVGIQVPHHGFHGIHEMISLFRLIDRLIDKPE